MIIKDSEYGEFDVFLDDDGTLDTVVEVNPLTTKVSNDFALDEGKTQEIRFSTEYALHFRDPDTGAMTDDSFTELAQEAVEAYIEQYLI